MAKISRPKHEFDLDINEIRKIVRALDPAVEVGGYSKLDGGSTAVYRIDFEEARPQSIILKIYPDEPAWGPSKERLVAQWLSELPVPVPLWLGLDQSRTILPLRFALTTLLPGRPLREWMGGPGIDEAYRGMGRLLRSIHTISMPAFGYIEDKGIAGPSGTNEEYMLLRFEDVFRRFGDFGGDIELLKRLQTIAQARLPLLAEGGGPVLCHDDMHQGNVLASYQAGTLELTGLIDFGNARAADKLFDLAKALFCSGHEDPRSRAPILEGYGPIDHPDAEGALWLYTLFHRVSMWCWLTRLGADPHAEKGPGGLIRDLREMACP